MLRSDAKPLSYIELEAFMEKIAAESAPAAAVEAAATREVKPVAPQPRAPEQCPHCHGRLSALDLKFGQCLTCRKPLSADGPGGNSRSAPVSIGI